MGSPSNRTPLSGKLTKRQPSIVQELLAPLRTIADPDFADASPSTSKLRMAQNPASTRRSTSPSPRRMIRQAQPAPISSHGIRRANLQGLVQDIVTRSEVDRPPGGCQLGQSCLQFRDGRYLVLSCGRLRRIRSRRRSYGGPSTHTTAQHSSRQHSKCAEQKTDSKT